jgi:hypothetical protein
MIYIVCIEINERATMNETIKNATGRKMIGYRYGKAPASGYSYNHMSNRNECGVSMASIGHMDEVSSFAVDAAKAGRKKYYYVGVIAGEGGDCDEICLADVEQITAREYRRMMRDADIIEAANSIVNAMADRRANLLRGGWNLGKNTTLETVEDWRNRNLR